MLSTKSIFKISTSLIVIALSMSEHIYGVIIYSSNYYTVLAMVLAYLCFGFFNSTLQLFLVEKVWVVSIS